MARSARDAATYQDVLAAPEDMVAELIGGELFLLPRPAKRHTFSASVLGSELIQRFQRGKGGPGGWWILHESEIHFGHDVLVPDPRGVAPLVDARVRARRGVAARALSGAVASRTAACDR